MERRVLLGLAALTAAAPLARPGAARAAAPTSGGDSQNSYTPLPSATATIARPSGGRGVMTVELGLDTPDAALRARAAQSGPRLRAAYATVVQSAANEMRPGAPPDVERLSVRLQAATDATLGQPGARLLLGTVMAI